MAGEVEMFEVFDVGVGERLMPAGDAFSGEQVQDGCFGDVVSGGEFECGCAAAVGLDELVDGVAGESASDVPGRLGLRRCGRFPRPSPAFEAVGLDSSREVFEFPQVIPFRVTPSQVHNSYTAWSETFCVLALRGVWVGFWPVQPSDLRKYGRFPVSNRAGCFVSFDAGVTNVFSVVIGFGRRSCRRGDASLS